MAQPASQAVAALQRLGHPQEPVLPPPQPTVRAACGSWKRIQLHHVSYDNLGHEPDQDLVPLRYKDHRNAHRAHQSGRFRDLRAATDEIVKIGGRQRARPATSSTQKATRVRTVATSPVLVIGRDGLVELVVELSLHLVASIAGIGFEPVKLTLCDHRFNIFDGGSDAGYLPCLAPVD